MFCFFSFHFSALIGAYKAKEYVENTIVLTESITSLQSMDHIKNQYPILTPFLKGVQPKTKDATNPSTPLLTILYSTINNYIYRRIYWIVGGIIMSILIAVFYGLSADRHSTPARRYSMNRNISRRHRR